MAGKKIKHTKQPCPSPKIRGRFTGGVKILLGVFKCGDLVTLNADTENIPDGTKTTFKIRLYNKGKVIDTKDTPLKGRFANKDWELKKGFKGWDPDRLDFRVTANDASADSLNQVIIHKYKDIPSWTWSQHFAAGGFGWDGKCDFEFKDRVLLVTVKIKLINHTQILPASGAATPAADHNPVEPKTKKYLKKNIEGILSDKWILHRKDCLRGDICNCDKNNECCKFRIKIRVEFVENGQHHEVHLFKGKSNWMNSEWWTRIPPGANAHAHEVGHLLGWYDEYPGGANSNAGGWQASRPNAVMYFAGNNFNVPKLYYENFRAEFEKNDPEKEKWVLLKK